MISPPAGRNPITTAVLTVLVLSTMAVVILFSDTPARIHSIIAPMWKPAALSRDDDVATYRRWPRHVIAHPPGRLGNEMFTYAALIGIATMNNMTPVYMGTGSTLDKTFENLTAIANAQSYTKGKVVEIHEYSNLIYDNRFERLHTLHTPDVVVSSYFQSWKYFQRFQRKVRRAFTFRAEYTNAVHNFLWAASSDVRAKKMKTVFVGVHIRRTDWVEHMPDHDTGGPEYFIKAVNIMTGRLRKSTAKDSCAVYVVCSDDLTWSKTNFPPAVDKVAVAIGNRSTCLPKVVYSPGRSASEDMATLAACNHTIMTVGTYGWWGAWLAGGVTIAYKKYPPHSEQLTESAEDYYPPEWIIIT